MEKTKTPSKNPNRVRGSTASATALSRGATVVKAEVQATVTRRKPGQPSKFSQPLWDEIVETIATYGDLIDVCSRADMPSVATVYRWMKADPALKEDMRDAFEMFSFIGHSVNQNILNGGVLSTGDVRRDIEKANDNRWFMGKVNRRDFGDKTLVQVETVEPFVLEGWMLPGGTPQVIDVTLSETPKEPQDDSQ